MNKWILYSGLCLIIILTNLEATIVNLTLPSIIQDLSLNLSQARAVLSTYFLSALLSFLLCGKLGSRWGEIRLYRIGVLIFFLGTLLCGLSADPLVLICGRFVQGFGFASSFSMSLILIRTCFTPERLPFILGVTTMMSGLTQSLGPSLGALILNHTTWRGIFFLKLPLIFLAFILSYANTNATRSIQRENKFDLIGTFLWSVCILTFFFSMECSLFAKVLLFLLSLIAGASLYVHSKKKENSFFPLSLFSHSTFRISVSARIMAMLYFSIVLFLVPLYLQNILEWQTKKVSDVLLFMTVSYGVTSLLFGYIEKYLSRTQSYILLIFACSSLLLVGYVLFSTSSTLYLGLIFAGIGFGISMPQTLKLSLENLQRDMHGTAMGLFCSLAFFGSLLGVLVSSLILEITSQITFVDPALIQGAQGLIPLSTFSAPEQVEVKKIFSHACGITFALYGSIALLTVISKQRIFLRKQEE